MDVDRVAAMAQAVSHPDRVSFLDELAHNRELSPRGFCNQRGMPLGTVSYHVRTLRDAGLIKATRTEPRRGALEHFHVLTGQGRAVLAWVRKAPRSAR